MTVREYQERVKPKSPLVLESAVIRRQSDHAVYCTLHFIDANGKRWIAETGHFPFDLTPADEPK